MTKTVKNREFGRVERLKRRADWLRIRISQRGIRKGLDYDAGELSSLEWAIPILEAYLIKKYTAHLDAQTLEAIKHQIPEHIHKQLKERK